MNKEAKRNHKYYGKPDDHNNTTPILHPSEARFRNLMEHIPGVSIQGYRCDGTVIYWNKASEEVYGYTTQEAVGKYLGDLIIPPDLMPLFKKSLHEGRNAKKSGEFLPPGDMILLHKDGHQVPVYSIHTVVFTERAEPMLFCIDLDLSKRRKMEEVMRESKGKLQAILESIPEMIIVLDSKGRYLDIFSGTTDTLVAPSDQLLGKTIHEVMSKKKAQSIQNTINRTLSTRKHQQLEYALEIDGINHWFAAKVVKFKYLNIECVLWAARDITDHKKKEKDLRESNERLELAVTGTNLGLWDKDFVTGRSIRNRQWSEMIGYSPEEIELRNDPWKDLIHPDDMRIVMKKYDEHIVGHSPYYEVEYRMRAKTGEWKWIQSVGKISERDDSGKPLRMIGTHRDITDHKRTDEAITKAKQEWECTFDAIPDLIMILDSRYRIIRANRAVADKLRIPITEIPGKVCYQIIHKTDAPPGYCPLIRLLKDGQEHSAEAHLDLLGGDYLITTTPIQNREGYSIGAVHVARDITGLKKMENELRESKERFELAISGARLGLWDQNIATGESIRNRQWYEMLGYIPEEIEPELFSWQNLLHPDDLLPTLNKLNKQLAGKIPFYEAEFQMRTKTGGWKWIQSTGKVSEWDDSGKPLRMIGTHRDITERKQAEDALAKYRDNLEDMVNDRTTELQSLVGAMSGREARMADLKDVIKLLRNQIKDAGMEPVADDPLLGV